MKWLPYALAACAMIICPALGAVLDIHFKAFGLRHVVPFGFFIGASMAASYPFLRQGRNRVPLTRRFKTLVVGAYLTLFPVIASINWLFSRRPPFSIYLAYEFFDMGIAIVTFLLLSPVSMAISHQWARDHHKGTSQSG